MVILSERHPALSIPVELKISIMISLRLLKKPQTKDSHNRRFKKSKGMSLRQKSTKTLSFSTLRTSQCVISKHSLRLIRKHLQDQMLARKTIKMLQSVVLNPKSSKQSRSMRPRVSLEASTSCHPAMNRSTKVREKCRSQQVACFRLRQFVKIEQALVKKLTHSYSQRIKLHTELWNSKLRKRLARQPTRARLPMVTLRQ